MFASHYTFSPTRQSILSAAQDYPLSHYTVSNRCIPFISSFSQLLSHLAALYITTLVSHRDIYSKYRIIFVMSKLWLNVLVYCFKGWDNCASHFEILLRKKPKQLSNTVQYLLRAQVRLHRPVFVTFLPHRLRGPCTHRAHQPKLHTPEAILAE